LLKNTTQMFSSVSSTQQITSWDPRVRCLVKKWSIIYGN